MLPPPTDATAPQANHPPDDTPIRAITAQFYAAANAVLSGNSAPMLALWSHADDATYCDPSGAILQGWSALEPYWRRAAAANAAAPAKLSAFAQIVALHATRDVTYTIARETVRRADGSILLVARATNIHRREGDVWRLVHRHADAAPQVEANGE